MTSETVDKETPPIATSAAADEVVGASENSSQNTDESVKNSQESETSDAKQEEASAATGKEQEDVEMKEAQADSKKEKGRKQDSDVEMVDAKDQSEDKADEGKIEDVAATATKEDIAADDKAARSGDVDMKLDDDIQQEVKSGATKAPKKALEAAVTPDKSDAPAAISSEDNVSKESSAETKDTNISSSPTKRKEPVNEVTYEISNGVNGVALEPEPAAKKQKVDAANPKSPEKAPVDTATLATNGTESASPSVMISRDDMAKMEEDSGRLKFDVITNDGTDEHMIQLTTLKNIFAKQLPKMPKEYIVRLVFDKNHRSMLLLKNGTHVIGGICYRPFEKNQFAEIAFCAINASDQVKGYGTRLMNHLKEYVKTKNITHFLTYADNYAIGYFKKQGFTKSVSMARPNWYGYIKDYDGGTLMECTIHTQINYLRITSMIHKQRKAIQDKIQERSRAKTVYAGLTQFAEGRLMDIYMVPGVKEAGWSQAVIRNNRIGTRDQGSLKSQLAQLLKAVSNHRSAWPFHEPVDTTVVVDYLEHIKEPVDLQLISKRIDSGTYISKAALKADLEKMCDNCTTYNTPDTNYYKAAVDLREFIQSRIQVRDHK